jgi:hypothetical protein
MAPFAIVYPFRGRNVKFRKALTPFTAFQRKDLKALGYFTPPWSYP